MGKNQFQGTQMALHSSTSVSKRYRKSVFLSSIPIIFITFLSLSSKPACNCSGSILRLHSTEVTISLVMYCTYNPKNMQNSHGLSMCIFMWPFEKTALCSRALVCVWMGRLSLILYTLTSALLLWLFIVKRPVQMRFRKY